jgi:hypothetical protein
VWDAVGEEILDRHFEGNRENVEAGEHILAGGPAGTGQPPEVVPVQVDEIEDAFLVELIGVVELASDNPSAVGEGLHVGIDEGLIVEAHFAARRVPRVVPLERPEPVDEAIGLRAVIVGKDRQLPPEDDGLAAGDTRHLHGLGAAGQLPQQLVPAAEGIGSTGGRLGREPVGELDSVHDTVLETRTLSDVELVAIAVARPQALIALARLVEGVEVHDQIELVVRAVGHPGVGVGVVGAGFVQNRQCLAMARAVHRDPGRDERRREQQRLRQPFRATSPFAATLSFHLTLSPPCRY